MTDEETTGLLLDTHIWIWLMNGDADRLSQSTVSAVERAANSGLLHVSAISLWEVAMLESRGRIRFTRDCLDWVRQALGAPGLHLLPLSPEVAVASSRLPGSFHGDPADRMLTATARVHNLRLVTYDERILEYGASRYVAVLGH